MKKKNDVAAIILAGGKGTRFSHIISSKQKVLYEVAGRPLIKHTTDLLSSNFIQHLVFNTGYEAESVEEWARKQHFSQRVDFSRQQAWTIFDAVTRATRLISENTIVCCNADEVRAGLDIRRVLDYHHRHDRLMTIVAAYRDHLNYLRLLVVDGKTNILLSSVYNPREYKSRPEVIGLVNAGLIVFEKTAVDLFDSKCESSGWDAILNPLCRIREIKVLALPEMSYFNIGNTAELKSAQQYFGASEL